MIYYDFHYEDGRNKQSNFALENPLNVVTAEESKNHEHTHSELYDPNLFYRQTNAATASGSTITLTGREYVVTGSSLTKIFRII